MSELVGEEIVVTADLVSRFGTMPKIDDATKLEYDNAGTKQGIASLYLELDTKVSTGYLDQVIADAVGYYFDGKAFTIYHQIEASDVMVD